MKLHPNKNCENPLGNETYLAGAETVENVTFGEDLENLRTLDLRNNYFVDIFTEIRLISLEEIFLSGTVDLHGSIIQIN